MDLYEEWNMTIPSLPPRSRLYCLEPIGIGTLYVESLTGYIARLADAHCVFPGVLMNKVVEPLVQKNAHLFHISHGEKTYLLNATGLRAILAVQLFEDLTMRSDLRHLTLLSWAEVLYIRGLFHLTKVWCPHCYEEWRERGQIVYDPLLWVFQPITMCVRHRNPLIQRCPYQECGRTLPALCWRSRPGYCAYCQRWLGKELSLVPALKTGIAETEIVWQQWVTEQMGTLLALSSAISVPPSKKQATETLTFLFQQVFRGRVAFMASALKLPRPIVNHWFHGRFPLIEMLLRICYALGLSLDAFLLQDAVTLHTCLREAYEPALDEPQVKWRKTTRDGQDVQQALENILAANEYPPPSLPEVARLLGHDLRVLSKWHRTLCQAISARNKEYVRQRTAARMQRYREELREAALELQAKGLAPTRGRIELLLPQPGILRNPKIRQLLVEICRELEEGA